MSISMAEVRKLAHIPKVIVHSLDLMLRHQSAYDEMINQPLRQGSNMLEVPLGRNRLGTVKQTIQ